MPGWFSPTLKFQSTLLGSSNTETQPDELEVQVGLPLCYPCLQKIHLKTLGYSKIQISYFLLNTNNRLEFLALLEVSEEYHLHLESLCERRKRPHLRKPSTSFCHHYSSISWENWLSLLVLRPNY